MSVFFLTGTLGAGKTLASVSMIKKRLQKGLKVATNLDLNLDKLLPAKSQTSYIRIPDKPTIEAFDAIGRGSDDVDESTYGLLVLDELGTWLNSRSWNDKKRQPVLDWFLHARKLGWDILFIVQDIELIDKQARDALCEFLVIARRMDKMPFLQMFMPKMHLATVYYGNTKQAPKTDRWFYRGTDFYDAYDTRQVFSPNYEHGTFSTLSNWHNIARYQTDAPSKFNFIQTLRENLLGYVAGIITAAAVSAAATGFGNEEIATDESTMPEQSRPELAKLPAPDSISKVQKLGEISIVGRVGLTHIFQTKMGQQTSADLVGMGFSVMYLRPCLGRVGHNDVYSDVTCSASRPSPQGAVARPKVTSVLGVDSLL
jgi:Zonular occludens toxin (Zot)